MKRSRGFRNDLFLLVFKVLVVVATVDFSGKKKGICEYLSIVDIYNKVMHAVGRQPRHVPKNRLVSSNMMQGNQAVGLSRAMKRRLLSAALV